MKTHYCRLHPRSGTLNRVESLIYNLIPNDELVPEDRVIDGYIRLVSSSTEYKNFSRSPKDAKALLDDLNKKGFLKEVYGVRLDRFIKSF